ncbi:UDP-N-acetylmuramate--L-alanine ligase [Fulvivirga sp. RKSG066]|uniref:UDP-N-acetylmuramate--L-alanine ligase n=1 Tax=Fulvivirga aurantia TaxID=2529383 RepID=UPI001625BA73|nr:UDP-N-acetylmuramate--L-alanine ligase [Fulvivirga aurantia]
MNINSYHSVYFIGIGGIGMSALARWFKRSGFYVAGYDKTETSLTSKLIEEGIEIHFEDEVNNIPEKVISNKKDALVIYTPAIPKLHKEFNYLRDQGFTVMKRSVALGHITASMQTVAIAGTHGKTTTSSMVAHILKHAGLDIAAFLGGIATNYESNFIANERIADDTIAVVEADEFDRSFLTLNPNIAVVTSADADHLDIYGDENSLHTSFKEFINKLKSTGTLFISEKIASELVDENFKQPLHTYGINQGQFFASNITMNNGFFVFDYRDELHNIDGLELGVPGFHNVENATVAIAVALQLGVAPEKIKPAIKAYKGVKRRFEYVIKHPNLVFVDDYAHHPVEIEAFLKSLQALYPDKKVTAIFQPHLYSRTRDFADGFAKSLSLADEVILLDIYPAREEPIEGVTSDIILKQIDLDAKQIVRKENLLEMLNDKDLEVVATIGAGDIDKLVLPIKEKLKVKYNAA